MTTESEKPTEKALLKMLDVQWQDHFQTRNQTWKALEVMAIVAVALVGLDWQVSDYRVTIGTAFLLALVAVFGMLITFHHRNNVEITKFKVIRSTEEQLNIADPDFKPPRPIRLWDIFFLWKSNTSLFILRMQFVILLFAVGYLVLRLLYP